MTTSLHMFGRYYKSMAIAVLVLAAVHVLLSFVFSAMSYRKNLNKQGGAWLFSFGICVAILVLSAIATGQKENFDDFSYSNTALANDGTLQSQVQFVTRAGGGYDDEEFNNCNLNYYLNQEGKRCPSGPTAGWEDAEMSRAAIREEWSPANDCGDYQFQLRQNCPAACV